MHDDWQWRHGLLSLKVRSPTFVHARICTYSLTLFYCLRQMSWSHRKVAVANGGTPTYTFTALPNLRSLPRFVIELCWNICAHRHPPMPRPAQHKQCRRLSYRGSCRKATDTTCINAASALMGLKQKGTTYESATTRRVFKLQGPHGGCTSGHGRERHVRTGRFSYNFVPLTRPSGNLVYRYINAHRA